MPEFIYSSNLAALASLKEELHKIKLVYVSRPVACQVVEASKSVTFLALLTSAEPTFVPELLALPLCFPITPQGRRSTE